MVIFQCLADQLFDVLATDKSRYFAITEVNNCYILMDVGGIFTHAWVWYELSNSSAKTHVRCMSSFRLQVQFFKIVEVGKHDIKSWNTVITSNF